MDTVEVVIKLPKEVFERIYDVDHLVVKEFVKNGTVLPKGHGDLVDGSKVVDIVTEYVPDDDGSVGNTNLKDLLYEVENMERVIEADREAEDD